MLIQGIPYHNVDISSTHFTKVLNHKFINLTNSRRNLKNDQPNNTKDKTDQVKILILFIEIMIK